MPITDPEFPYEMEYLQLDIRIPKEYPKAIPIITVDASELTPQIRDYINIECKRASNSMSGQMSVRPLLKYIDTNLETWMTLALRPSIKIVPHTDIRVSPKPELEQEKLTRTEAQHLIRGLNKRTTPMIPENKLMNQVLSELTH